jgi:peptide-methionine (S)-S-oxide reductase
MWDMKEEARMDKNQEQTHLKKATFGAGCFWGVEAAYRELDGVVSTEVGYAGGHVDNPTYQDVCSGRTGHAEVVKVIYNPKIISYQELLDLFWDIHDPTTLNRQGPDFGEQYRSVIFYHDDEQEKLARKSKKRLQLSGRYNRNIVTEIEPAHIFWKAEEYHQKYLEKIGQKSCRF